jgi:hypothetical protein
VFIGKFTLAILPEESRENLMALEGGFVHWYWKEILIGSSSWGKWRESQCVKESLCLLLFEERLYWQFLEENHANLTGSEKRCVCWHLKKIIL